jgi:hypothetical protein
MGGVVHASLNPCVHLALFCGLFFIDAKINEDLPQIFSLKFLDVTDEQVTISALRDQCAQDILSNRTKFKFAIATHFICFVLQTLA